MPSFRLAILVFRTFDIENNSLMDPYQSAYDVSLHAPLFVLTLLLLMVTLSSADSICKQFGSRSGPTERRS